MDASSRMTLEEALAVLREYKGLSYPTPSEKRMIQDATWLVHEKAEAVRKRYDAAYRAEKEPTRGPI